MPSWHLHNYPAQCFIVLQLYYVPRHRLTAICNLKKTTTKTYIRKISIEQHHHKGNQPKFVNNHDANYLATPATVARPPDHGQ